MSTEPEQETVRNLAAALVEQRRLRTLSNEGLVKECAASESYDDIELIVEEMMNRLWPEWVNQKL